MFPLKENSRRKSSTASHGSCCPPLHPPLSLALCNITMYSEIVKLQKFPSDQGPNHQNFIFP